MSARFLGRRRSLCHRKRRAVCPRSPSSSAARARARAITPKRWSCARHPPPPISRPPRRETPKMAARIAKHRSRRGVFWHTVEEPIDLAASIRAHAEPTRPILVDCLTLWLSNLLCAGHVVDHESEKSMRRAARRDGARSSSSPTRLAWGWCLETPLGREFRDADRPAFQPRHRRARRPRRVFVAAGLPPVVLKGAMMRRIPAFPNPSPPIGGEGGTVRGNGRVRWARAGVSPTSPRPSPPPRAERMGEA